MKHFIMIAAIAAAAAGCGKGGGGGGGSCGPLKVTIDGQPIDGLTHGLGVHDIGGYSITLFNHDKTTCDEMMSGARAVQDGEKSVTVSAGGQLGAGISYDANTKMGTGVDGSVKTKPAKAGDPMAICINGTVDLQIGDDKGKKVHIEGEVDGQFCGDRK